ncbi:hypothetical protein [Streptococcus minor]|uniref:hypothetical protein n=1 Tax=Streptococcus minor TaxID=229549 RepID=UPI0012EA5325|nr:hypothetical protein [Streptococcus minor]
MFVATKERSELKMIACATFRRKDNILEFRFIYTDDLVVGKELAEEILQEENKYVELVDIELIEEVNS